MKINFSIVTVVLNRKAWIREAIESVLAQNYPFFEHIVIDGGSTDGTLDIITEYPHLKWISEPDGGSVYALNKGISRMQGNVFGWLNSDETYFPDTFRTVAEYLSQNPDWGMVYGSTQFVGKNREYLGRSTLRHFSLRRQILGLNQIPAPSSMFLRKECLEGVGGKANEKWKDAYDHDLWIRIGQKYKIKAVPHCYSTFALHADSGVSAHPERALKEVNQIRRYHGGDRTLVDRFILIPYFNLFMWGHRRLKWNRMLRKGDILPQATRF